MKRICTNCRVEKDITCFHKDSGKKCGYKSKCKTCTRKTQKIWESKNRDKRRKYRLKGEYDLTPDQYEYLLNKQHGECAICKTDKCITGRRFAVDHCHITGRVRGLLCQACNTGLGKFNDNLNNLEAAIKYLKSKDISDDCEEFDEKDLTDWN